MKWLWMLVGVINGLAFFMDGLDDGQWNLLRGLLAAVSLLLAEEIRHREHVEEMLRRAAWGRS